MKKNNSFKLSLSNLSKSEIKERDLCSIKGGDVEHGNCSCGCNYSGSGGSSLCDNSAANFRGNLSSPGGGCSCSENTFTEQQFWLDC